MQSNNPSPISILYEDVFLYILIFLPESDWKNASLVAKKWRKAILEIYLLAKEDILEICKIKPSEYIENQELQTKVELHLSRALRKRYLKLFWDSRLKDLLKDDYENYISLLKTSINIMIIKNPKEMLELLNQNMKYLDLSYMDLSNIDLQGVNLTNAILKGTNLKKTNISGVTFKGAKGLTSEQLLTVKKEGKFLNFKQVIFPKNFDFSGINKHADFTGATLISVLMDEVENVDLNFTNAYLEKVNLSYSLMSFADFTGAILYGVNLAHAHLLNADFTNAYLKNVDMRYITINATPPNFTGTTLIGVIINDASIKDLKTEINKAESSQMMIEINYGTLKKSDAFMQIREFKKIIVRNYLSFFEEIEAQDADPEQLNWVLKELVYIIQNKEYLLKIKRKFIDSSSLEYGITDSYATIIHHGRHLICKMINKIPDEERYSFIIKYFKVLEIIFRANLYSLRATLELFNQNKDNAAVILNFLYEIKTNAPDKNIVLTFPHYKTGQVISDNYSIANLTQNKKTTYPAPH